MRSPRVGLLGPIQNQVVRRLAAELERRGAEPSIVDLPGFPEALSLRVCSDTIVAQGIALDDIAAAYVAAAEYMSPVPDWVPAEPLWDELRGRIDPAIRRTQGARSVRVSVVRLLSDGCALINPPDGSRACRLAPALLRRLEDGGIAVAPFVSGNDLERIAYFVDSHAEKCHGRRLGCPSVDEVPVDFDYLKAHHLDFDRFPLIVRASSSLPGVHVLVVGGQAMAQVVRNAAGTWERAGRMTADLLRMCERASAIAGLEVALWHVEMGLPQTPAALVGVVGTPDLAALQAQADVPACAWVAEHLLHLAGLAARRPKGGENRGAKTTTRRDRSRAELPLRIGIAGQVGDREVGTLARAIETRGAIAVPVELPLFPDRRALHECADGGRAGAEELRDLDALFLRTTGVTSPLPDPAAPPPDSHTWRALRAAYARTTHDQAECFLFKYAAVEALGRRIPVINPPAGQECHRTKVHQVFALARAGLPVPPTIAGRDAAACARFVQAQGGPDQVVHKPLTGPYKTKLLSECGLDATLATGPVLLQRYVRGETIRAYIVGGRLVGAGRIVHSGRHVDSSVETLGVERVELPAAVTAACARAAELLGLTWTGMDIIRDAETEEHFILECNASAVFSDFSAMTGIDVPGALAELLVALARGEVAPWAGVTHLRASRRRACE